MSRPRRVEFREGVSVMGSLEANVEPKGAVVVVRGIPGTPGTVWKTV